MASVQTLSPYRRRSCWTTAAAIPFLLAAAYWLLSPALSGGFLLDDYANLGTIGTLGGIDDPESLRAFVLDGFSGPTGRPVAMLSFLLDTTTWPASPYPFKYTNLLLHLLNGCLVIWTSLLLCRFYGIDERKAQYLALFNGAAWLLHPYLISTTFYIVQRMAMLSALFCLAGIVAYLHGRLVADRHPRRGLLWMAAGLGGGTLLATFSKENGALLPLLLLVIEFCRPYTHQPLPRWFRWAGLYLPSLALAGYLASTIDLSPNPWPHRPFNQPERLLTEARILWEYLGNLLLPTIEGSGLYQDGRIISHGLSSPPTTLLALTGLVALAMAAIFLRRRFRLFSLAVLFFLAGHLLESSLLGLELYFEHRNYLPSVFLFLPLADGLHRLATKLSPTIAAGAALAILATFGFLAHQRAILWGDNDRLNLYWALATPESPRAQSFLASYYLRRGQFAEASTILEKALKQHPDSPLLVMQRLLMEVETGHASIESFQHAASQLLEQPIDGQAVVGLRQLVAASLKRNDPSENWIREQTLQLIDKLETDSKAPSWARRIFPYLEGRILLAQGASMAAEQRFSLAIRRAADIDAAMQMVAEMASHGEYRAALRLLDQSQSIFRGQRDDKLRFSRDFYQGEIQRIRRLLQSRIGSASRTKKPPSRADVTQ